MKAALLFSLIMFPAQLLAAQFTVYYYLPTGSSGRQEMTVQASDFGAARRVFQNLMPRARISEIKAIR